VLGEKKSPPGLKAGGDFSLLMIESDQGLAAGG
jgi:hypothetical protein